MSVNLCLLTYLCELICRKESYVNYRLGTDRHQRYYFKLYVQDLIVCLDFR